MTPKVATFLDRFSTMTLYSAVGEAIHDQYVVTVDDWSEAYASATSSSWERFGIDRHNEIRLGSPNDFRFWEAHDLFVDKVKDRLHKIITGDLAELTLSKKLEKKVFNSTAWHLLHACMEIEYEDFAGSSWHLELADWYFRGHFPCGWEGDWPEDGERSGNLIIY